MVLAIILTVMGLGVASMGMKCTNCGGDDKVKRARIAMTGGIILVIGGNFALIFRLILFSFLKIKCVIL